MKLLITLILLLPFTSTCAQSVEFTSALSLNSFYNKVESPRQSSTYSAQPGPFLGFTFSSKKSKFTNWRIFVGFENYGGMISVYDGGNGGGTRVEAKVNRSALLLGFYPLNIHLWNNLTAHLGFEASKIVYDGFEGTSTTFLLFNGSTTVTDLKELHSTFNNDSFGACLGLSYTIKFRQHIYIVPQYTFYNGLTYDFSRTPIGVKSRRHRIGIGIRKEL